MNRVNTDSGGNTIEKKRFPIFAGMKFTYPGTTNHRMKEVGYYIVEFKWSADGDLVYQKKVKTVFY